ncbi:Rieske 2Fe-2S domain-containing protein [Pseudomonas putida]
MKSITLDADHTPYLAVGGKTYFLNRQPQSTYLLPTQCPHRGGPLHLGQASDNGQRVICPWHDNAYPLCNLEKKALPTVRVGKRLSTVIPAAEHCTPLLRILRHGETHE